MGLEQIKPTYLDAEFQHHPDQLLIKGMVDALQSGSDVARDWFEKAEQGIREGKERSAVLGDTVKNTDFAHRGFEDVFTQADKDCEAIILPKLKALRDIPIVSEEDYEEHKQQGRDLLAESDAQPDGAQRWLVDPIDGTFCFKKGLNDFSMTLALQEKVNGEWLTKIGMVAMPMHRELYVADGDSAYVIQNDRAKKLHIKADPAEAFSGLSREDVLKDKKVEVVVYSKTDEDLNEAGYDLQGTIPQAMRTYSSAYVISKLADGWVDGVVLAANAMDYAWDTDAAIHIAEKAGAAIKRTQIDDKPLVILAQNPETIPAIEHTLKDAYRERTSQRAAG